MIANAKGTCGDLGDSRAVFTGEGGFGCALSLLTAFSLVLTGDVLFPHSLTSSAFVSDFRPSLIRGGGWHVPLGMISCPSSFFGLDTFCPSSTVSVSVASLGGSFGEALRTQLVSAAAVALSVFTTTPVDGVGDTWTGRPASFEEASREELEPLDVDERLVRLDRVTSADLAESETDVSSCVGAGGGE